MVELRRLESGVMMRWRRRVEEVARKLEAGPPGKERERRPMEPRMGERGDVRGGYGRGPPGPEIFDKKMSKTAYDRRQSKLPPRLAKQREVSRAQARGVPGQLSPGPSAENGWPEGDKMGVFSVEP